MAENTTGSNAQTVSVGELDEVVRLLGVIFSNTHIYGANHGVTKKAADDCFQNISTVLGKIGELSFSVSEAGLSVNLVEIEMKNPLFKMFAARLADLEVSSFSITTGIPRESFDKLIAIMNLKPDVLKNAGGFATAIVEAEVNNVRSRVVTYKAVTEDEVIVSKQALEDASKEADVTVDEMIGFLGGDASAAGGEGGASTNAGPSAGKGGNGEGTDVAAAASEGEKDRREKAIQDIVGDPDKLGDVILKAAHVGTGKTGAAGVHVQRGGPDAAGAAAGGVGAGGVGAIEQQGDDVAANSEAVTSRLVGCLQKVYDVLSKNPIVRTQKGKKQLSRSLELLEKQLMTKLIAQAGPEIDLGIVSKRVSEVMETMHDELEIDALATEYMKKRAAIELNEKRLLRFMKGKSDDKEGEADLYQKLVESGLTASQWQDLLRKSGQAKSVAGGATDPGIASLLSNMENLFAEGGSAVAGTEAAEKSQEQLAGLVTAMDHEINELVDKTEQKLRDFARILKEDEEAEKAATDGDAGNIARRPQMSRKKMMILLAEIVQELCQPLAVINCSIDMIRAKHLGAVSEAQLEMLNLASTSGDKARLLADRLLDITGLPTTLSPDANIQHSLYSS